MFQVGRFASNLKISQRFLAGICFFSLPLGVLFYFNVDQISEKINFARGELAGNRFQRPAVRLLKALADYLMIGSMESLASMPEFESKRHLRSVYYQLKP